MPQLIFLDTEFTGFTNPKLISIGLSAETGEDFYAETDYVPEECSSFVLHTVIPLLEKSGTHTRESLRLALLDWLERAGEHGPVLVCHDSEFDRTLFEEIFRGDPPPSAVLRRIGPRQIDQTRRREYHLKHGLPVHHALYDAQALRYAFRGWVRNVR